MGRAISFVGADDLPQGHWLHHPLMLRGAYSRSAASGGRSEAVARQRPAFHGLKGLKRGCRNEGRVAGAVRPLPGKAKPPGWIVWHTASAITVGRDDYPKGTGSGSRSYLAGRHWRPARRDGDGFDGVSLVAGGGTVCHSPTHGNHRHLGTGRRGVGPYGGCRCRLPFTRPWRKSSPRCGRFVNRPYGKITGIGSLCRGAS